MKATPVQHLYVLSGTAPPDIRREISSMTERQKQLTDARHPLYGHVGAQPRLQSRKSFLTVAGIGAQTLSAHRRQRWLETYEPNNNGIPEPAEHLPPGSRHLWVSLYRARTGVAKTGENMLRWGFSDNERCECGEVVLFIRSSERFAARR